jgi:hypothetical protein
LVVHAVISSVSIVDFNGLHPQPAAGPTAGPDRRNARTRLPPPAPQGRKNQRCKQVSGGEAAVSNLNQS